MRKLSKEKSYSIDVWSIQGEISYADGVSLLRLVEIGGIPMEKRTENPYSNPVDS